MNLLEMVTYLRDNILDDTGGQGVDWTGYSDDTFDSIQLRWRNEEIVANINEAVNQVYRRTNPIKDVISLPVLVDTYTYSLPSYIQSIEHVKRATGEQLRVRELSELWHLQDLYTRKGIPIYYIPDVQQDKLQIYPAPLIAETLQMVIYRYPKLKMVWSDNDLTPELKEEYHVPMLFYAAHLCYLKDEANTLDPQRSAMFSGMFDKEFPFTSVYSNISKRRKSNRACRYGGL
jgi:hypothetical protein